MPDSKVSDPPSRELKTAGLKVTLPRLKVLSVLEGAPERHWTAEDVYRACSEGEGDIGLATIYRVLTQFENAGLVLRRRFDEGQAVFELDTGVHHDHIVCTECGHIEEFVDSTIEARQNAIAGERGFVVADHALVIYGTCAREQCPRRRDRRT